jgi:hypothetical protein
MNKYTKKPITIEAVQFLGADSLEEIMSFMGKLPEQNVILKTDGGFEIKDFGLIPPNKLEINKYKGLVKAPKEDYELFKNNVPIEEDGYLFMQWDEKGRTSQHDQEHYHITKQIQHDKIIIDTLEGQMTASIGDYIIRGINGELYPCKPDIFEKSYSKAEPFKIINSEGNTVSLLEGMLLEGEMVPVGKVYPSEEETVFSISPEGDEYGGAHLYLLRNNLGFSEGKSNYDKSITPIRFVEKKQTGEMIPGIQSEQLVIALVDRIKKLNAKFPCDENDEQVACLEGYLAACQKRIDNRINRGVMGDLKK